MADVLLQAVDVWPGDSAPPQSTGLNLSIAEGDVISLLGDSADWVSEWMQCLAGMSDPCKGHMMFMGQAMDAMDKLRWQKMRTEIAFLDRHSRLLSVQTLLNNVTLPAFYHNYDDRSVLVERARAMLEELNVSVDLYDQLPAYINDYAYTAALMVRALLMKPRVIIIDDFFRLYNKLEGHGLMAYLHEQVRTHRMAAIIHNHDVTQLLNNQSAAIYISDSELVRFDRASDMRVSTDERILKLLGNIYLS